MSEPLLESSPEELGRRSSGKSPRRRAAVATRTPPWLRAALAKRNLRPHGGWPPVHHLLTERDLPSEEEEDQKVPVSTAHDELSRALCTGLVSRYRRREDVFVAHDLFVYFDGRRTEAARLAPDLLVSFGAPKRLRGSYAVWEEGKPPDFVLEILSESTWRRDVRAKPGLYQQMGVREYFLFDPHGHIDPLLRAWRFADGRRERLPVVDVADGMRGVHSEALNLHLCHTVPWRLRYEGHPQAGLLRWHDPSTGRLLETAAEMERRADDMERWADDMERRAAEEARARRALESRVAELEARLRR